MVEINKKELLETLTEALQETLICPECWGDGCKDCHGSGRLPTHEAINFAYQLKKLLDLKIDKGV